jgi:hypothetical protein
MLSVSVFRDGPRFCSWYSNWLRPGRSGDRIPVGARFSAPVQTGPGAHPNFCTTNTGSFPRVKLPMPGVYCRPSCSAAVKDGVELYLYSHLELRGTLCGEPCLYLSGWIAAQTEWCFGRDRKRIFAFATIRQLLSTAIK